MRDLIKILQNIYEKLFQNFLLIVSIFVPQENSKLHKFRVLNITAVILKLFLVLLHLWLLLTFHVLRTTKISQSAVLRRQ